MISLESLLRADLEAAEDLEVIVSLVELPPRTRLPIHRHPGEEFAYLMEGSAVLWQEGKDDQRITAGQTAAVPREQVHTTYTEDEPVKMVVFRVHRKGEPERILVDQADGETATRSTSMT
jgi:quercetin dioxygenase-like cupin family protein